jgi:hypothetical protein
MIDNRTPRQRLSHCLPRPRQRGRGVDVNASARRKPEVATVRLAHLKPRIVAPAVACAFSGRWVLSMDERCRGEGRGDEGGKGGYLHLVGM